MLEPSITVIVPCFNGQESLDKCIKSVVREPANLEILIIDDGSTDNSLNRAVELMQASPTRIIVLSQTNQGQAAARNLGIRAASGKYLCFLDVDDELSPGAIAAAVGVLENDASIVAVQGRIELVNLHRSVEAWQRESMEDTVPGNIVVRTDVAREMGGFPTDGAFRGKVAGEDGCFRMQIPRFGKVIKLDRPFLRYHVRRGSHADYFLDRSTRKADGSIAFSENSPEERDGTLHAAFNRYVDKVTTHLLSKVRADIQRELGGGVEFYRLQQQLVGQTIEDIDLFEAFALYSFAKRWPAAGSVVAVGPPTARSTRWLAAACKAAGNNRLISIDCFPESPANPSSALTPNATTMRAELGDFVELISDSAGQSIETWRESIRLLCIPNPPRLQHACYDLRRWLAHLTPFGLLMVNRSLIQSFTTPLNGWKHLVTIQRLAIFEKPKA